LKLTPPIALRLLTLNLLVFFLPVAGLWSLRDFEQQLLLQEERAMVAQARALAAGIEAAGDEWLAVTPRLIERVARPLEGRVRIFDAGGVSIVDTATGGPGVSRAASDPSRPSQDSLLYRLGRRLWRFATALKGIDRGDPAAYGTEVDPLPRAALARALAGGYGAQTQLSPDGTILVLSSAVPISGAEASGPVRGAVVVSRTTLRVLRALDEVRVQLFGLLLLSLAVAAVLSLWFARGLAHPLHALARESVTGVDADGRLRLRFSGDDRSDEIGALARALGRLSQGLARRLGDLEAFAADAAHEIKNPLATVRSAVELLEGEPDAAGRRRLEQLAIQEVGRIERLLGGLRTLARLESEDVGRETFDAAEILGDRARVLAEERGVAPLRVRIAPGSWRLRGAASRFEQLLDNLVGNALDLAPADSVELAIGDATERSRFACIEVADRGPGIPAEHLERVFDRFFSYRPGSDGGEHLGLGLGIVRAIVERHGGTVEARPRPGGGTVLRVLWPRSVEA
jgi:two-component system sensor histidine kinase ChvG